MTEDAPASDQFDLSMGMHFGITVDEIETLAQGLENAEEFDPEDTDDETLAEFVAALKRLESAAEDARKDVFEEALDDRVDEGETVGDIRKMQGSNRYVTDNAAAFDAVLDAGEDPRKVAKGSAPKLADLIGDDADELIGESSYSYFRRQP